MISRNAVSVAMLEGTPSIPREDGAELAACTHSKTMQPAMDRSSAGRRRLVLRQPSLAVALFARRRINPAARLRGLCDGWVAVTVACIARNFCLFQNCSLLLKTSSHIMSLSLVAR